MWLAGSRPASHMAHQIDVMTISMFDTRLPETVDVWPVFQVMVARLLGGEVPARWTGSARAR
jgi:hypothetical protein